MASEKITAKIIANAQSEAAALREEAQAKAKDELDAYHKKTAVDLAALEEKNAKEIEEIHRRAGLMTRLEARKKRLGVKGEIITEAFTGARKVLDALDDASWEGLILQLVLEGTVTGHEKLQVPQQDRDRYLGRGGLLARINDALQRRGIPGQLTLSDQAAPFEQGVLIEGELSDINASFDNLIADARDQYEHDVAQILFDSEV